MTTESSGDNFKEKRNAARAAELRNYRVEIKFVGKPIYQFRVTDVSMQGAGILINANSRFLKTIERKQILEAKFISPRGEEPSGMFKAEIKHITEMDQGLYKGHIVVGIQILERIDSV